MEWLKKRLIERTTWIGITTLLSICGYSIAPEYQDDLIKGAIALISIIFVGTSDKKRVEVTNVPAPITDPDDEKRAA